MVLPARPSLPEGSAISIFAASFSFIADPKQLNHGIGERESSTSRTLSEMLTGRSLMKTKLKKFFSFGSALSGTDEQVVQFDPHMPKSLSTAS